MSLQKFWRQKDDQQLRRAARELLDYREEAQAVIRAELARRKMLGDPDLVIQEAPKISQPKLKDLLTAFRIKEEDLMENRLGRLSMNQKSQIQNIAKAGFRFTLGFAIVFSVPMYTISFLLYQADQSIFDFHRGEWLVKLLSIAIMMGTPTLSLIRAARAFSIYLSSIKANSVNSLEGTIQLTSFSRSGQGFIFCYLFVQGRRFAIGEAGCRILNTGNLCRVYYEPTLRAVVAMEPL